MNDQAIKKIALSYVGQTEKAGNQGFNDPVFHEKMKRVGFEKGMAWCSFFAELVWTESYRGDLSKSLACEQHFSGSAVETYNRFKRAGFQVVNLPVVGALAVWRYGNGWQGHIGVVTSVTGSTFKCVEGNTNDNGGREVYMVAERLRRLNQPFLKKGLNLVGFVLPI